MYQRNINSEHQPNLLDNYSQILKNNNYNPFILTSLCIDIRNDINRENLPTEYFMLSAATPFAVIADLALPPAALIYHGYKTVKRSIIWEAISFMLNLTDENPQEINQNPQDGLDGVRALGAFLMRRRDARIAAG